MPARHTWPGTLSRGSRIVRDVRDVPHVPHVPDGDGDNFGEQGQIPPLELLSRTKNEKRQWISTEMSAARRAGRPAGIVVPDKKKLSPCQKRDNSGQVRPGRPGCPGRPGRPGRGHCPGPSMHSACARPTLIIPVGALVAGCGRSNPPAVRLLAGTAQCAALSLLLPLFH